MALGRFLNIPQITAYNGYSLVGNETVETVGYKITPQYDSSGRTVVYSDFEITLHWFVADANTTSPEIEEMVAKLQRPAGVLDYTARGFGATAERVNRGRVWDVNYGPKPGPVELKPRGGTDERCVEVTWSVKFAIPTCDDAIYKNAVREFCFTVDYDRDRAGLVTRTYKAHVSIAVTRKDATSTAVPDTAERLLDDITPPVLLGFYRDSANRGLSEDKATLTLAVVDREWPAFAPPAGCVSAKVSHKYATQPPGLARWGGTFTGNYEVAKSATTGRDTMRAVEDFLARCDQRFAEVAGMIIGAGLPGGGRALGRLGRGGIIPTSFSVEEPDVYGNRQIAISMGYMIAGMGASEILEKGGLWSPWGTQYNVWQASVPTLNSARGFSNLVFSAGDDRIVDLCGPTAPAVPSPGRLPDQKSEPSGGAIAAAVKKLFPGPSPPTSWIEYQNHLTVTADTGRVIGTTLPTSPIDPGHKRAGWDALAGVTNAVPTGSAFPPLREQLRTSQSGGEHFVHQRTKPRLFFTISGFAVRWGFPVPVPELLGINGESVALVGRPAFATGIVGNALDPIYGARWSLTYTTTGDRAAGSPIEPPPNPDLA